MVCLEAALSALRSLMMAKFNAMYECQIRRSRSTTVEDSVNGSLGPVE